MWQFGEAVRGIGDACRALDVPITGGNVSLYNETEGRPIFPTPVLGVVGLLEDAAKTVTRQFKSAGAAVVVLGDNHGELGGSEYLARLHGQTAGEPPQLDLAKERALQRLVVTLIRDGLVESAHDCAEGGVAVALAECTFDSGGIGVEADVASVSGLPADAVTAGTLFGESASRIVVSAAEARADAVLGAAAAAGVPAHRVGRTGGSDIRIDVDGARVVQVPVSVAEAAWATAIEHYFAQTPGGATSPS
jgi:phosphoribosylformylglycinamidine synthase